MAHLATISGLLLAAALGAGAAGQTLRAPVLDRLREDVSAILGEGAERRLLIVEDDHGISSTRTLAIGEEYRDGWRLEAIAPGQATLRKGERLEQVPILGRRASETAQSAGVVLSGAFAAGNSVEGSRRIGMNRAGIEAAAARGDLAEVGRLGGTAADAVAALRVSMPNVNLPAPEDAALVNMNGRVALAGRNANGGFLMFTNDNLGTFGSPDDLPTAQQALGLPNPPPLPPPPPPPPPGAPPRPSIIVGGGPGVVSAQQIIVNPN